MSEFGGLWKHQNNPSCTKKYQSLHHVEVGHYTLGQVLKVSNARELFHLCDGLLVVVFTGTVIQKITY